MALRFSAVGIGLEKYSGILSDRLSRTKKSIRLICITAEI
jgi:hypothetical protein